MRDYIDIILLLSYNFSILLQVFQVFGDILDALHSNFIVLSQVFKRRKKHFVKFDFGQIKLIALMIFLAKIMFHGKHFPDFFRFEMFHVKHKTQKISPDADIWNRDPVTAVILSD